MKNIFKVTAISGGMILLGGLAVRAADNSIQRVGAPEKICQLTGETDWQTGKPTAAKTYSNFGLDAADLGYPVEHNGKLILLFGDSWPTMQKPNTLAEDPPNDAVGIVTSRATPISAICLGMTINDVTGASMRIEGKGEALKIYQPATVVSPRPIQQGFFDVPTGGVSVNGALYGFFWTAHCAKGHAIHPSPDAPLARPKGDDICPETDARNSVGHGMMARSTDDGRTFQDAVNLPPGFTYTIAVNPVAEGGASGGVLIFGAPRYRTSVPYLAEATAASFPNPQRWRFMAGRDAKGEPKWVGYDEWAGNFSDPTQWHPPKGSEIYAPESDKESCVGEMSITRNQPLKRWLMTYNCTAGIEARVAQTPSGPWSAPVVLLGRGDDVACKIVMSAKGCGERRDFWPLRRTHSDEVVPGGFYAPFVLNRYTKPGARPNSTDIYWLVSTWNPYEVDVMHSTLTLQ